MRGLLVVLILCIGCAPGFDGVRQVITNGNMLVIGAVRTVSDVDSYYKQQILHDMERLCKAKPEPAKCVMEEGEKRFTDYKMKRDVAVKAIKDTSIALKAAADILPLVEAGSKNPKDLNGWISKATAALPTLSQAVSELGLLPGGK